ncbi:hypothetical protein [Streptomyces sp. NPDC016845]|uniref:hypothetical protein n=1 Tax=Streptomyces sp. NPDC016845 TaxID=3364972 RepID=UPI0037BBA955
MNIVTTGIRSPELRPHPDPVEIHEAAAEPDQAGWGAPRISGLGGGDILGDAERLPRATENAEVVTGVLSIWRHAAADPANGPARVRREYGHRLLLRLGVSDAASARRVGGAAHRPLAALDSCPDTLDRHAGPVPTDERPVPTDERLVAAMEPELTAPRRPAGADTHPLPRHTRLHRHRARGEVSTFS